MDASWVSILVGVFSSLVTAGFMAATSYAALKSWMARREERELATKEKLTDHEDRIRDLERDVRPMELSR